MAWNVAYTPVLYSGFPEGACSTPAVSSPAAALATHLAHAPSISHVRRLPVPETPAPSLRPSRRRGPSRPSRTPWRWRVRADALGAYLTGAASDGAAQADPDAALGNYRASTASRALGALVDLPCLPPVVIEHALGANGEGTATIRGDAAGRLYFTPPGGDEGSGVLIVDGDEQLLEGADIDKAVRVSRDGATTLLGSMTADLRAPFNGAVGMDNVTHAERAAGLHTYRGLMLRAHGSNSVSAVKIWIRTLGTQRVSNAAQLGAAGAGTIQTTGSLADWPDVGYAQVRESDGTLREIVYYTSRTATTLTVPAAGREMLSSTAAAGAADDTMDAVPGIRLALEAPAAGKIQTIANEATAPAAVAWNTSITAAAGLAIAHLDPAENYGLWLHRQIPAGATVAVEMQNAVNVQFVDDGTTFDEWLTGLYRVADTGQAQYELYVGESGSEPDFTAAADATSATLPFSHAIAAPGAGEKEYRATCRQRNAYDLLSLNQYSRSFNIDDAGDLVTPDPTGPEDVALKDGDELVVKVHAKYFHLEDGDDAADTWLIYATDTGADPVPGVDAPEEVAMKKIARVEQLFHTLGPYAAAADVRVIVCCERSTDSVSDGNTTVYQLTTPATLATPAHGRGFGGSVNEYR